MQLDDRQIERYSRQIILREVGPEGQERLLDASVGIVGAGTAAERAAAYLAATGVGRLAMASELHACVDSDQGDVTIIGPADPARGRDLDAAILCGATAHGASDWRAVPHVFWIAEGGASEVAPCVTCAMGDEGARSTTAALARVRDALLGTVIATEVVKALLSIGDPLRGRVLTYDPDRALVIAQTARSRPTCSACGERA